MVGGAGAQREGPGLPSEFCFPVPTPEPLELVEAGTLPEKLLAHCSWLCPHLYPIPDKVLLAAVLWWGQGAVALFLLDLGEGCDSAEKSHRKSLSHPLTDR